MGYDVSYHPIRVDEMKKWYFDFDFDKIRKKDFSQVLALSKELNIDEFYIEKYKDTLTVGAESEENSQFDTSHGYLLAIVQGFFRKYFYTRSTAFSFLIEEDPKFASYAQTWKTIVDNKQSEGASNMIAAHFSSGVYINPENVKKLLADYEQDQSVKLSLEDYFQKNTKVLLKALNYAKDNGYGLLEACEVVEPNPLNIDLSTSYSNLFNCDQEGVRIYYETAQKQLKELALEHGISADQYLKQVEEEIAQSEKSKQRFWKKLFVKTIEK